jgi:hypothetical protein
VGFRRLFQQEREIEHNALNRAAPLGSLLPTKGTFCGSRGNFSGDTRDFTFFSFFKAFTLLRGANRWLSPGPGAQDGDGLRCSCGSDFSRDALALQFGLLVLELV